MTRIQNTIAISGLDKFKLLLFLGLFLTNISVRANDTLIWRSIPINNGLALTLSSSIDELKSVVIQDKKRNYHLMRGTFGGADSISILTNKENLIISVSFHYTLTYTFEQHLEAMESALQKPQELITTETKKIATWQDNYSRFRLFWIKSKGGKTLLYSTLEDL